MIPAPPQGKPVAFYDTECFPNLWLLKIRPQNGPVFSFHLRSGESFSTADRERIEYLFSIFQVISFNGIYYDVPMIAAALAGFTCDHLKWVSDQIIVAGIKPWDLGIQNDWKPTDHIDIMEVAPGAGSLKQYAGRIHSKTMWDLPYDPNQWLSEEQITQVDSYCENDLNVLEDLYKALAAALDLRNRMSAKYGIDLRSKSDAQLGEAVIKLRCEQVLGQRIYKPEINWNLQFRYDPPSFMRFEMPILQEVFDRVKASIFSLGASGRVEMPHQLEGLQIAIGSSVYQIGIGGLHSTEKKRFLLSDEHRVLRDCDVRGYYPNLILNSGKHPPALGPAFRVVYGELINERSIAKTHQQELENAGDTSSPQFIQFRNDAENGKIATNGPYGKTGSPFSPMFAPEMMIQTTVTGQLSILMLIEAHELNGIPVVSANTDGILIHCPRSKIALSDALIKEWENITGLEMESSEYTAVYSQSVNSYLAIKANGKTKRIGLFAPASLLKKHDPDVEICSDAVAEFLSKGTPILYTLAACRDIRKFVRMQKVTGGAVKLWGVGPRKEMKVRDMGSILAENGWEKNGRNWKRLRMDQFDENGDHPWEYALARDAYKTCFQPQRPEYLGKVVRWYYGTNSPGSIIYNTTANTVGLSYGAQPCMTLPETFPPDVDYQWYFENCEAILKDVGYDGQL